MKYTPQDLLRFEEFLENEENDNLENSYDNDEEEEFLELTFGKKKNKKRDS